MKRKTAQPTQAQLIAAIQPVILTPREERAMRLLSYAGMLRRRDQHGFDPLELRLGLRARYLQARPWFAISNAGYHEVLNRHPELDDSRAGTAWLHSVYFGNRRECVTLPRVRAMLEARMLAADRALRSSRMPNAEQGDLFTEAA